MKKFSIVAVSILITCCLILLINDNYYEGKIITDTKTKNILNTNALTMMYETGYQSGEYQVSSDTSWPQDDYVFNETLSKCENGGTLTWNSETNKVVMQTNSSDRCYVYFDKEPSLAEVCSGKTFAECITTEVYTTDGDNGLYYHDADLANGAQDNSYRYSGANPNNYVCFGSDAATCPSDSLYRIIGVFGDEVKLKKNTSYGRYAWDSEDSNTWNSSTKPDIRNILNITFLNTLGSTWQNKIVTHEFKVGGGSWNNIYYGTPKTAYNYEVGANSSSTTDSMKIGLMYVSDFGFASSNNCWTTSLGDHGSSECESWIPIGLFRSVEWTITRNSSESWAVFRVNYNNSLDQYNAHTSNSVRPVFYLNSDVQYISGTGTQTDPYRIN